MKIIFISDIVGQPGREILASKLPALAAGEKPDFIIANGENSAGGKGITTTIANEMFLLGINVRRISASLTSNQESTSTFGAGRAGLLAAFQAV